MKFITTRDEQGKEELFVFPRTVPHDAMAEVVGRIRNQMGGNWRRIRREPVSAGFVDAAGECFGHSETLGLSARPEDSVLLASQYSY